MTGGRVRSPPTPIAPRWDGVVLVCKACEKRSKGPKHLTARESVAIVRRVDGRTRPRPRVLLTGCLGLCPKRAAAVAVAGDGIATRIVAVRSKEELAAIMPLLRPPRDLRVARSSDDPDRDATSAEMPMSGSSRADVGDPDA